VRGYNQNLLPWNSVITRSSCFCQADNPKYAMAVTVEHGGGGGGDGSARGQRHISKLGNRRLDTPRRLNLRLRHHPNPPPTLLKNKKEPGFTPGSFCEF